jgi:hypothetical protein
MAVKYRGNKYHLVASRDSNNGRKVAEKKWSCPLKLENSRFPAEFFFPKIKCMH